MSYKPSAAEPIAIIGMACRFAGGATSPARLWQLLANPRDVSRRIPASRFNVDAFYHPDGEHPGTTNSPSAYFLDQDHRVFDASFFNTTPKEAEAMDPQQRMLLEVVYEALESAGYSHQDYAGVRVGVFAGLMTADYDTLSQRDELTASQYYATGNARSMVSNRLSYFFDFKGPSMTIDTACSSSLVALHQAVLSLRSGDCEMACVAGANLILTPEQFIVESSLHMLSPSGHCNMFDANADGYARGEGIAAVFVRPISKAIANNDPIVAVIRETGVNSDGRTTGITMPNWEAQAQLIQDTYRRAGLNINSLEDRCQYFECHGTGTGAGDPNEARAIEHAFFSSESGVGPSEDSVLPTEKPSLLVGSVKTIIGHTEGAAGLAGLFKVVESIRHDVVPPNLHLRQLNPQVAEYAAHLAVPTSAVPWPAVQPRQPKRGSINSFGFGGTNAHAIIEQYVPALHAKDFVSSTDTPNSNGASGPTVNRVCLPLVLSAKSERSLVAIVQTYYDYLVKNAVTHPQELAWHTYTRRTAHAFRVSISSTTTSRLLDNLGKILERAESSPTTTGMIERLSDIDTHDGAPPTVVTACRVRPEPQKPKLLGVFTGQGAQWATMSRGLLVTSKVYADSIRELDRILQQCPHPPPWNLEYEILADEGLSRVNKSTISQPLCTAIQIALVDLLHAMGIFFHTVVGHSSGEIGAAYAAGRLGARDAILVAYYRGLDVKLACGAGGVKGGMIAAGLSKEEAAELCSQTQFSQGLCIAAVNSPSSVTLSGDIDLIHQACAYLVGQHKFARILHVDTAYHSPHMEALAAKYLDAIRACDLRPMAHNNGTVWISSVSGTGEPDAMHLKDKYWQDNMMKPVLFCEAVTTALAKSGPFDGAIEVGPHCALKGPALQTMQQILGDTIPYTGLLNRGLDDREAFAHFLGWIWARFGFYNAHIRQFVLGSVQPQLVNSRIPSAPSYPWDHSRSHWRESRVSRQYQFKLEMPHELLGVRTRDDNQHQLRWRNVLKLEKLAWLRHHTFQGQALLPASAYIVMTVDAAKAVVSGRAISLVELQNLKFLTGITFESNSPGVELLSSLVIEKNVNETVEALFTLTSTIADGRTDMKKNFTSKVIVTFGTPSVAALPARRGARAETLSANPEAFYIMMAGTGLKYTGPFKGLQSLDRRYEFASGSLRRDHPEDTTKLGISPATLDSCLQASFVTVSSPGDGAIWTAFLPAEIECVRLNLSLCDQQGRSDTLAVDAFLREAMPYTKRGPASFTADVEVFNGAGQCEIQIEGLKVGSLGPTKPEDDHELFLTTQLDLDPEDSIISATEDNMHPTSAMLAESCERVASFYTKSLKADTVCPAPSSRIISGSGACQAVMLRARSSWPHESEESLDALILSSPYYSGLNLIRKLGQNIPDIMAGMLPTVFEEAHQLNGFQRHISRVIKQIAHKYASMNVLGLTDAQLGLSEHVLAGLGSSFSSYRIGAQPEDNFEVRIRIPESLRKKITVQEVDFHTDVPCDSQLYDLVLLSTSLFDVHNTATVLGRVRDMMRPGGFLMLIHVTRTPLEERITRCFTPTPQQLIPSTPPDWPDLLEQCGFYNSSANSTQSYASGFSLIVRQAQSLEKEQLRYPAGDKKPARLMDKLLIIGGKQLWTALISSAVSAALALHFGSILSVETLEDLDPGNLAHFGAVIFLGELDESVLMNMSEKRMEALKELLRPEMVILWVTESARGFLPENSATLGFTRTLAAEIPGLTLQVLDLETVNTTPAVKAVSETFFRLVTYARLVRTSVEKPLWNLEPEIHIKDGCRMVPRVLPWKNGNARANACRRLVTVPHNTLDTVVEILPCASGNGPYTTKRWELGPTFDTPDEALDLRVSYSTANAHTLGIDSLTCVYLCLGRDTKTNVTKVALAKANASYIAMPKRCVTEITVPDLNEPVFFALLVRYYLALTMAFQAKNRSLLVIEPDPWFQECVKDVCVRNGKWFQIFSTDEERCRLVPGMVFLHPALSRREIKELNFPKEALVLDMLPAGNRLTDILKTALGESCTYLHGPSAFRTRAYPGADRFPMIVETCTVLEKIWDEAVGSSLAKMNCLPPDVDSDLITLPGLLSAREPVAPFSTIHWQAEREIEHIVSPPIGLRLLSPSKTYLLVGMTRDLGQSLCTLLVQQGGRFIILASRSPPKELPRWAVDLQRPGRGVQIRFETLDVTSSKQVTALKAKMAQIHRFPPVGGVVNGAMVLDDRVFSRMSLESFQRVMAPKTIGSRNLDDAFCTGDMDFFIMTSSFAAIGGHAGQSNYAAANMFMNGLAAWRRHRGFVGSILNIGVIYGLGFLHREKENLYEGLEREGYPPISERDLHHMFIEAIAAGKPTADQIYDLTTGLRRFPAGRPTLHWHRDPRFCHYTRSNDEDDEDTENAGSQELSLKEQISRAGSREDLVQVLVQAFMKRLQSQLKLAEGILTTDHSIIELGVDSLAAVDIRAWVWKTLGYDVAVMKILSGITITQLCEEIATFIVTVRVTRDSLAAAGVPSDASATPHTTSVISGAELEAESVATSEE